jgi:protease-4
MGKKIIAGLVLGIAAISLLFALVLRPYERAPQSSYAGGGKVGVIYIEGAIAGGSSSIFAAQAGADAVAATIREAAGRPELKAVVVRLNSPGGTPAAAQEIDAELQRLRQAGKVVVASMGDVAASGAYWIAAGADRIVANPGTMTGSIGVLMQTTNLEELYGKIGIDSETFKSGPYKDMGSTDRPVTPEERAIFQAMIDDIYDQFVEVVARGNNLHRTAQVVPPALLADYRTVNTARSNVAAAGYIDINKTLVVS